MSFNWRSFYCDRSCIESTGIEELERDVRWEVGSGCAVQRLELTRYQAFRHEPNRTIPDSDDISNAGATTRPSQIGPCPQSETPPNSSIPCARALLAMLVTQWQVQVRVADATRFWTISSVMHYLLHDLKRLIM